MYESNDRWQEFYCRLNEKALSLVDPRTGSVKAELVRPVSCAVCGVDSTVPRAQVNGFIYVTCRQCGFVYLNPQLRPEALADSYNDAEVRRYFFEQLLLPFVERDQEPEFQSRLRRLTEMTGTNDLRLLDVGCAAGKFLMMAQEAGFRAEGLELNAEYVEFIRVHRRVAVRQELLADAVYPEDSFDVVTLWDVLEHVPDPRTLTAEIARILKPGGIVALTTINHDCFNERILGKRWRYWMPPDHVCSFSPAVLRRVLEESGFHSIMIEHHAMWEVLADVCVPWIARPAASSVLRRAQKLASFVLAWMYQTFLNVLHSGDLLTVYARKR